MKEEEDGGQFAVSQRQTQMQANLYENINDIKVCNAIRIFQDTSGYFH